MGCVKVNVECYGYDFILKMKIFRSYVFYFEMRVKMFEKLLDVNDILYLFGDKLDMFFCWV